MLYSTFLSALQQSQPEQPTGSGMVPYLCALARAILNHLGQEASDDAIRRLAAISGLVRACAPGSVVVMEHVTLTDFVAARVDITPNRQIILAERTVDGVWQAAPTDPDWCVRVKTTADALGLPHAACQANPRSSLTQAQGLISTRMLDHSDPARHISGLVYGLGLWPDPQRPDHPALSGIDFSAMP